LIVRIKEMINEGDWPNLFQYLFLIKQ